MRYIVPEGSTFELVLLILQSNVGLVTSNAVSHT